MITEKQVKIVNAVNQKKAEIPPVCAVTVWGNNFGSYEPICTIEEYNQCIEEMKYHYDIPKWCSYNRADKELLTVENSDQSFYGKETFAHGQDVYVKDTHFANESIKFGCLALNGENAILLTENGYMVYPIAGILSKPIKSKEDIELEAKEEQISSTLKILNDTKMMKFNMPFTRKMLKIMQERGLLTPIKLTEEE